VVQTEVQQMSYAVIYSNFCEGRHFRHLAFLGLKDGRAVLISLYELNLTPTIAELPIHVIPRRQAKCQAKLTTHFHLLPPF
jgi:hypothetical protein